MTRGIHLKQLRTADLELLGLEDERSGDQGPAHEGDRTSFLAEADPALARVIADLRRGLEGALLVLDEALEARDGDGTPPATQARTRLKGLPRGLSRPTAD